MVEVRPVEVAAQGLLLRPWTSKDASAVFVACQDAEIQRWTSVPVPYGSEDAQEFVDSCAERWAAGTPNFAVTDATTGTLLGSVDLQDVAAEAGPMLGYWVDPAARGRGVAGGAVRAICGWGFASLGLQRIQWAAQVGNVVSRRVAETCGFTVEGRLRRGLAGREGPADAWIGSLLPGEPMARRATQVIPYEPVEVGGSHASIGLRAPTLADATWVLAAYQDRQIAQWNPADVDDLTGAEGWVRMRADWSNGDHASWLVVDRASGAPVGSVSLHKVNTENKTAAIGYWTHPHHRGQGFAAKAIRLASNWALGRVGLQRIELIHAVANEGSCRVAQRAGFELEGVLRSGERYGDGQWYDEHIHARIRTGLG